MPNVLVIDDDEDYREYLTTLLSRYGYQVHGLRSGRELDAIFAVERFDAVVSDLYMPGVDGIEVVRKVKELLPDLPIIGITGGSNGGDACSRAMTLFGAQIVLTKPLDATALFDALQHALAPRDAAHGC
jgi:DNA-binding NtrC family response regulator